MLYRIFALTLSVISLSTTANTSIKELQQQALADTTAYQLIESLTTEVGPRLAGSDGDKKAVAWAERKLTELGFDKVYKEPVPVRNWQRQQISASITAPYPQTLAVTALGGTISTPVNGLEAEVVRIKSLDGLSAAPRELIENKIVYLSVNMERDKSGDSYSSAVGSRIKGAIEAAKLGAKAIIIRSLGTDSSRLPHTGSLRYSKDVTKIPAAAISNADADLLERMFSYTQPVKIKLNIQTSEKSWQDSYNVIGEITGTEKPEEIVLLAAHLDSWDLGTGALDNGAGVGIVTAAASLAKSISQPKRTIRVVLFANEEFGLKGAKAYAKAHSDVLNNIVVATESDFGAGKVWRFDSRFDNSKIKYADELFNLVMGLDIERGHNQAFGGPDVSVLARKGVPVVSWVQDGTNYFDYHHTANDTFDKIELADIQQNVAVYATFAYWVANGDMVFK